MENFNKLFVKGCFYAYTQGMRVTHHGQALIKINNVDTLEEAKYYVGKTVAFVGPVKRGGSKKENQKPAKVIYGKITRTHGNNGAVRAKFHTNLPSSGLGSEVRVMLYPQSD